MTLNSPPKAGSRSSDFVGIPVVITAVHGEKEVETSLGDSVAVVIDLLVLDRGEATGFPGDEDYNEGEQYLREVKDALIFWSVVRRQLLSGDFNPPVAGKFQQSGKAYTLDELTDDELALVESLLA